MESQSSLPKTHAIVNFLSDNSVEVLPKSWISDGENRCQWPKSAKVKKWVGKSKEPLESWPFYDCKVIKWFDSFEGAKARLDDAQYTSDLSGNESKRPRKDTSRMPAVTLPVPPSSGQVSTPTLVMAVDDRTSDAGISIIIPTVEERPGTSASMLSIMGDSVNELRDSRIEDNHIEDPSVQYVFTETGDHAKLGCSSSCEEFQRDVLLKLEGIGQQLKSQTNLLQSMMIKISDMSSEKVLDSPFSFPIGRFPMKSIQETIDLNNLIAENKQAYDKLVLLLKCTGGGTVDEAVKFMLKTLMTDETLAGHCFKGQSVKKTFSSYEMIMSCMLDAMVHNPMTKPYATRDNLYKTIPKGLKQAADRIAQRRKMGARTDPTLS